MSTRDALRCRFCNTELRHTFVDLGMSPLARRGRFRAAQPCRKGFTRFRRGWCQDSFLVQLKSTRPPRRFSTRYLYFSTYSDTWLEHARRYAEDDSPRFAPQLESLVEVGSNDGYLLRRFEERGVLSLGRGSGATSRPRRPTRHPDRAFLRHGEDGEIAAEQRNHRPARRQQRSRARARPQRLLRGSEDAPSGDGVITMEFPHLLRLIAAISLTRFTTSTFRTYRWHRRGCLPLTVSRVRRRGAAEPRRFAADLCPARRRRLEARGRVRCGPARS